jgi:hypothetical protein
MDRRVVFAAGIAASVALTALLWALGVPGFFLFLLFPFLWFPFGGGRRPRSPGACPRCAAAVRPGFAFWPASTP